jgi:hypothetical protein
MSDALNIRDIQTIYDLKNALGRFAEGTQESLDTVEAKIADTQKWLEERGLYWLREMDKAKRDVEEASENLRRCHLSGYRDADGYYHQPDCRTESVAVRFAEERLRNYSENFENVKAWQGKIEQAVSDYHREARRLSNVAASHTEKAQAFLVQTAVKYEKVKTAQESILSFPPDDPPPGPADSTPPKTVSIHPYRPYGPETLPYPEKIPETEPISTDPTIKKSGITMNQETEEKKPIHPEGGSRGGLERGG